MVGAQSGKSASSLLQQSLLLASRGNLAGTLPVMAAFFLAMLRRWLSAVGVLAGHVRAAAAERSAGLASPEDGEEQPAGGGPTGGASTATASAAA